MKGDREIDSLLQQRFARLRDEDARRAPDFSEMVGRARRDSAEAGESTAPATPRGARTARPGARRRVLRWVVPMAVAAGLAAIAILPDRGADREFDRLVTEWSRTSEATRQAPTDGLLSLPGVGLLGGMPAVGSGVGAIRGRS